MAKSQNLAAANALREARELMNDSGKHWHKGNWDVDLDDGSKAYCSAGALRKVTGFRPSVDEYDGTIGLALAALAADPEVNEYVLERIEYNELSPETSDLDRVINWNDDVARTWEDISAAFERAEQRLRNAD